MKINSLALTNKGIVAFEAPEKSVEYQTEPWKGESKLAYQEALRQAIDNGVKFKDQEGTNVLLYGDLVKGKVYPIPDSYHVEIKDGEWSHKLPNGSFIQYDQYAILVPKEKAVEEYEYCEGFNKKPCPVEAHGDICPCIIAASFDVASNLIGEPKQQSIEEAAEAHALTNYSGSEISDYVMKVSKYSFIAGAKWKEEQSYQLKEADLRKAFEGGINNSIEYCGNVDEDFKFWYEQFKQEKP